jgi:iron complex transport system substrate-binding protein
MNADNRKRGFSCSWFARGTLGHEHFRSFYPCLSAFIGGFTAFCFTMSAAASITVKDDLGRSVEMRQPAQRIVTLAPFLTELAYSAGAGDRVVGVSAFSDYPPQAKSLPVVSSAVGIALEPLVALAPDLVLAWRDTIRPEDIERLERFGVAVFVAQARRLDDVPRLLGLIGRLAGRDASSVADAYSARIQRLRREHAGIAPVRALLEIWHRPLTTIAGDHWMNEALEVCGATNDFRGVAGVAPVIPWEQVYARDPRVVVGAGSAADAAQFHDNWRERPTLAAVRENRLVFVDADTIQRPTLRLAEGVAQLCAGLDRVR